MSYRYISAENWQSLFTRFPGLDAAMATYENRNELRTLERLIESVGLNDWESRRLTELRILINRQCMYGDNDVAMES